MKKKLRVLTPSVLIYSSHGNELIESLPLNRIKRGALFEKLKQLRSYAFVRISNQEQFNDICEVSYDFPDRSNKLKCVIYFHSGKFESEGIIVLSVVKHL